MFTSRRAGEIVLQGIFEVTGQEGTFGPRQRLHACGIDTAAKLKRLKAAIVALASREGRRISVGDLRFDRDATVAAVRNLIFSVRPRKRSPRKILKKAKKAAGKRPAKAAKAIRRVAKKGPPKKAAKKAAPRKAAAKKSSGAKRSADTQTTSKTPPGKRPARPLKPINWGKTRDFVYLAPLPRDLYLEVDDSAPMSESASDTAPPEPAVRTVESTPQLEIRRQETPNSYEMEVWVDQGPADPGADIQPVKVSLLLDVESFELDVWLDCSSHFDLAISDPKILTVNAASGVSNKLQFNLTVLQTGDDRPMYVSAFFRYQGRPCGRITRFFEFRDGLLRPKKFVAPRKAEGEVVLPLSGAPPSVAVDANARPADIRVEVLKTEANDGRQFTLKCYTPQGSWEGPWNLPQVSKDLVNAYMKNFMQSLSQARVASLKGAGMDFWRVLPAETKKLLLDALEKGARTMSVISEEPYIPWELMVPHRRVQDARKPLGVDLLLGRWVTGDYTSAAQHVPMKSGYVICPKTSGLASSTKELAFLTQQLRPDFDPADEVTPASFVGVDTALAGPPRHVIHFICHGKSALLQTLELDKPDTLDCSQVRALKGFQTAFQNGPLAFLNACEVGGLVLALDGVGGFANSFIELGASAVVAPLWPVQDTIALEVTQIFYTQALKGVPFADVMRTIRAKAYEDGVDSYAAYCFYGDPLASAAS